MDVTKILLESIGNNGLQAMAEKTGMNTQQASSALEGIIPTMLGSMAKNTSTPEGAQGLLGALDRDHDGSVLDDVAGFLQGGQSESMGAGILRHVLGANTPKVESSLADKVGVSSSQLSSLLKMAAPLILGYLGKQKRANTQSAGFDMGNIGSLLASMAGNADQNTGLDLNDVFGMVGALTKPQEKSNSGSDVVGGLLKGLFG